MFHTKHGISKKAMDSNYMTDLLYVSQIVMERMEQLTLRYNYNGELGAYFGKEIRADAWGAAAVEYRQNHGSMAFREQLNKLVVVIQETSEMLNDLFDDVWEDWCWDFEFVWDAVTTICSWQKDGLVIMSVPDAWRTMVLPRTLTSKTANTGDVSELGPWEYIAKAQISRADYNKAEDRELRRHAKYNGDTPVA